jgi:dTDP-L-rhamnose 4-epimerase
MPATPRTVLVTGSAGRIGRAVCRELLARGHRVRGFDRLASRDLADQLEGDLSCPADVEESMEKLGIIRELR